MKKQDLKNLEYSDYLQTDYWQELAKECKRLAGHKCQLCSSKEKLRAHHRSYENRGDPKNEIKDLVCLCADCHERFHKKSKYMTTRHATRVFMSFDQMFELSQLLRNDIHEIAIEKDYEPTCDDLESIWKKSSIMFNMLDSAIYTIAELNESAKEHNEKFSDPFSDLC